MIKRSLASLFSKPGLQNHGDDLFGASMALLMAVKDKPSGRAQGALGRPRIIETPVTLNEKLRKHF